MGASPPWLVCFAGAGGVGLLFSRGFNTVEGIGMAEQHGSKDNSLIWITIGVVIIATVGVYVMRMALA